MGLHFPADVAILDGNGAREVFPCRRFKFGPGDRLGNFPGQSLEAQTNGL